MNVREYGDFLQDILDSIDYIEDFLTGYEADDFINDKRTVFAVLWCLHVLGGFYARLDYLADLWSSPYSGVCMSWERLQSTYPSK